MKKRRRRRLRRRLIDVVFSDKLVRSICYGTERGEGRTEQTDAADADAQEQREKADELGKFVEYITTLRVIMVAFILVKWAVEYKQVQYLSSGSSRGSSV